VQILSGNWEVADYMGQRVLRSSSGGRFMIPLAATLPSKFTLELDLIHSWGWATDAHFVDADHSEGMNYATFGSNSGIGAFQSEPLEDKSGKLYHARIMADGEHVKVYVDGKRVANVPTGKLGRSNGIWIDGPGSDNEPFYVTSIRVAASDKTLFDALSANGRVSTHGILFNTNSDVIRPESAPTLQEIGDMLKAHADLKLTIEGHTDNVGNAAANQSLSDRRAASVRQALITQFGIDASRLVSKGYGATKPASSNDTPEGRQQNRRVELVKM
jgi:outer membrane protein OmpA-like peptidoglycan-associated protein